MLSLFSFIYSNNSMGYFRTGYWWVSAYNLPRPTENTGNFSPMGAGMTFEYLPFGLLGVETGLIMETHYLNGIVAQHLVAPLMIRFWFQERFTFGVGAFYSYQLTNTAINLITQNYGPRVLLGINWPIGKARSSSMAIEGVYQYGYANLANIPDANFYESQLLLIVGFRFGKVSPSITSKNPRGRIPFIGYSPPAAQ